MPSGAPWNSSSTMSDGPQRTGSFLIGPEPALPPGLLPSAVLVPLIGEGSGTELLLTRRSPHLAAHKGQISFPGGGREEGETFWQAALREAREEIGLGGDAGTFLGRLPTVIIPVSGFFVVPFVVHFGSRPPLGEVSAEVDVVFFATLDTLRQVRVTESYQRGEMAGSWPVFLLPEGRLWGATAIMTDALLGALG